MFCMHVRVCAHVFDAASGIGDLVQPMIWYYQTTFSLPAGLPYSQHLASVTMYTWLGRVFEKSAMQ